MLEPHHKKEESVTVSSRVPYSIWAKLRQANINFSRVISDRCYEIYKTIVLSEKKGKK